MKKMLMRLLKMVGLYYLITGIYGAYYIMRYTTTDFTGQTRWTRSDHPWLIQWGIDLGWYPYAK